jgi:hypothetical protein
VISHKHNTIFIHVPKCTSIESAFGHDEGINRRGSQDHRTIREIESLRIRDIPHFNMDNARILCRRFRKKKTVNPKNNFVVNREQYDKYFKFAIVRNPYSRIYSWYRGIMRDPLNLNIYGLSSPISFEDFLEKFLHGRRLMKPSVWFIKSFSGEVKLDFIGKFENLEQDFGLVCNRLNKRLELPHKLDGGGTDWRVAYNDRTRSIVANFYQEDIKMFGYKFE